MKVVEYELKNTKRITKKDKKREKESKDSEKDISFYYIVLEAIKYGQLPRTF